MTGPFDFFFAGETLSGFELAGLPLSSLLAALSPLPPFAAAALASERLGHIIESGYNHEVSVLKCTWHTYVYM